MKIIKAESLDFIRLSFGNKSLVIKESDINTIFDTAIKVFSEVIINKTVELKNHCPLKKPETSMSILMTVREEQVKKSGAGFINGKSKNKTLYGISESEALEMFLYNYKNKI